MIDLKDLTYKGLEDFMAENGEARFRAKQVFAWLYKGVESFDEMTDLPAALRQKLSKISYLSTLKIQKKLISKIDNTKKYLFSLEDGECIESVVMHYHHGISICISSQVGCRMGCKFCASTLGGLTRNLTPAEIINQIIFAKKDIGERISNVVMMGIGEPLDNFEAVKTFLENVNHPLGLNIGYRHISISTCGLAEGIDKLSGLKLPITLSISLHAPTDKLRSSMMPVNKAYPIDKLMDSCRRYQKVTGRRISFEYALADGVNDSIECANRLADLIGGMLCHVNLIPINTVKERDFKKSSHKNIKKFMAVLESRGINATVRRELGSDILASCGQLRKSCL